MTAVFPVHVMLHGIEAPIPEGEGGIGSFDCPEEECGRASFSFPVWHNDKIRRMDRKPMFDDRLSFIPAMLGMR